MFNIEKLVADNLIDAIEDVKEELNTSSFFIKISPVEDGVPRLDIFSIIDGKDVFVRKMELSEIV